jgi:hypothetical protein
MVQQMNNTNTKSTISDPTEERIARMLIACLLDAGYTVSVYDGEEFALKRSRDADTIIAALASTDHDVLHARDAGGVHRGTVLLIWGNGTDLISDYSVKIETVIAPVNAFADMLS